MRRLNNRGYLIVELILASVLAMTVAYFLLNLVVKMSAKNQDLYLETKLLTDKAIMTNMVMEDVNKYTLVGISDLNNQTGVTLEFMDSGGNTFKKKMVITTDSTTNKKYFEYGKEDGSDTTKKELNSNIVSASTSLSNSKSINDNSINDKVLDINMTLNTLYSNANYGLSLTIPYNSNTLKLEPTIKVKSEYEQGFNIKKGTVNDTPLSNYFDYFPSNGTISCNYNGNSVNTINDVISGKVNGTYKVSCNVSYKFNGNDKTSNTSANLDIIVSTTGSSVTYNKYFYYASSIFDSQGNDTEQFGLYRCDENGEDNCMKITNAYGMYTPTTAALNYGFSVVPEDPRSRWYYSSCDILKGVTTTSMTMHRCENDKCSNAAFANPAGYSLAIKNVSISSEIVSNSKKVYYSEAQYSRGERTRYMDLYVCDLDPEVGNCTKFATAAAYIFFGNGDKNGNGISYQVGMATNDKYFFYTTEGSRTDALNIVRCNYDGTGCTTIATSEAWSSAITGSELYPRLVADNNNLYFTSYDYEKGTIYECNEAGEECKAITSGTAFTNNAGAGLNVGMAINSDYIFYSSYSTSRYDVVGATVSRCKRNSNGSDCKSMVTSGATINAGPGMEMQIAANDDYVFYTFAMQNKQSTARINKFLLYRCKSDLTNCEVVNRNGSSVYLYGYLSGYTGNVIPYKIMLTR